MSVSSSSPNPNGYGSPRMNIRALLGRLSKNLAAIKEVIRIETSANDYGLNSLMETRIMHIYNISTGLNLHNINLFERNYPAIDGADPSRRLMVQVTSTFSHQKIEHTINQVLDHKIYEKYDRLQFIFLNDKKKLPKKVEDKIASLVNGKFEFEPDKDIIDLRDIYRLHYYNQDIEKILNAVNSLDEVLNYLPADTSGSGYDALAVCFHDEEIENVYTLVDVILREGINVYITSRKLYDLFAARKNHYREYLIYYHPGLSLNNVTFCITVLSNAFISMLQSKPGTADAIYNYAKETGVNIEYVTFDTHLQGIKHIRDRIGSYRSMQRNLTQAVKLILAERLKESAFSNIKLDEIKQEIINAHSNFSSDVTMEETDFFLLNLKMADQDDIELNYLVLGKDYTRNNAIPKINAAVDLTSLKNLNILVPKDFSQKTRKRLDSVKTAFNSQRVFYVDEHLFDKRYKSLEQPSILGTSEFVSPVVKQVVHENEEQLQVNDIIHWILNDSSSSVAIIYGSGGIGKTTVCQKIHDDIVDMNARTIVVFINAEKYIEVLGKRAINGDTEYDIYNIFNQCHKHGSVIDRNSFYLNYSLGNIIVIFDGIDEIISTIPSFNLFKFLDTLENLRIRLGRGKILINCRDTYSEDVNAYYKSRPESNIQMFELLGFSDELAKRFFSKHFNDEETVKTCLKLVKEIFPNIKEPVYKYPPFILEIVTQINGADREFEEVDTDFNSKILQPNEHNDVVIYRICNREYIKKEKRGFQLDIDQQVRFLCELAIEEKGSIRREDFERMLQHIGIEDRSEDVTKGLIDHPLILKHEDTYVFRYDFFGMYFKAVSIFNMLATDIPIHFTERLINILAYHCNFNSVISNSIISKAKACQISFRVCLDNAKNVIQKILDFNNDEKNGPSLKKKKAISNILVIVFTSKHETVSNEYIINDLFGQHKKEVNNFYWIDVPAYAGIQFDFSGFYFSNSEINNYGSFFNCKFDKNTFFDETCTISNVYASKINLSNVSADLKNFDRKIKGDNSIFRIMVVKNSGDSEIKRHFRNYLEPTYIANRFYSEILEKTINIIEDEVVTVNLLTKILKANGIVTKSENGIIYIDERFKFKIIKFLNAGLPFPELNRSVTQLRNRLLGGE